MSQGHRMRLRHRLFYGHLRADRLGVHRLALRLTALAWRTDVSVFAIPRVGNVPAHRA